MRKKTNKKQMSEKQKNVAKQTRFAFPTRADQNTPGDCRSFFNGQPGGEVGEGNRNTHPALNLFPLPQGSKLTRFQKGKQ